MHLRPNPAIMLCANAGVPLMVCAVAPSGPTHFCHCPCSPQSVKVISPGEIGMRSRAAGLRKHHHSSTAGLISSPETVSCGQNAHMSMQFGAGMHPDLPPFLVHFVGRPRGIHLLPVGIAYEPEQRMLGS